MYRDIGVHADHLIYQCIGHLIQPYDSWNRLKLSLKVKSWNGSVTFKPFSNYHYCVKMHSDNIIFVLGLLNFDLIQIQMLPMLEDTVRWHCHCSAVTVKCGSIYNYVLSIDCFCKLVSRNSRNCNIICTSWWLYKQVKYQHTRFSSSCCSVSRSNRIKSNVIDRLFVVIPLK